jgi:beta-lactamase superfamily II metal-dependent hydrolase
MKKYGFLTAIILIIAMLCGCSASELTGDASKTVSAGTSASGTASATTQVSADGKLKVTYIDVGQADSILVTTPDGKNMLIDAGEDGNHNGTVVNYLSSQGITELDAAVATHPHSDHISAMDNVLKAVSVDSFYMPGATHTTKDFENMTNALESVPEVNEAKAGMSFTLGDYVNCEILAPVSDSYDNINNYSVVIRLTYGNSRFLFTGDAEKESEKEILNAGYDVSADVLKCGHHGSSTSSSTDFLDAVSPTYAVISCGKDNDYGHPHKETLSSLNARNINILRTDELGTVVITSDGNSISVNGGESENVTSSDKTDNTSTAVQTDTTSDSTEQYIGNSSSKKYHRSTCSALPSEKNRVYFTSKQDAENQGYSACGNCKP